MQAILSRREGNLFSRAVQKLTNSEWSHIVIRVNDLILESSFGTGFHIIPLSEYLARPNVVLKVYEIEGKPTIETVAKLMERHYGYLQSIGYLFMKLFNLKKNPSTQGVWCSEAVLVMIKDGKYRELFTDLKENSASPQDLEDIFKQNPDKFPLSSI